MYAWNLTVKTIMHEDEWVRFFRDVGYTGPNFDNDLGYRTEEEYRAWEERKPLWVYTDNDMGHGFSQIYTDKNINNDIVLQRFPMGLERRSFG